MIWSSLYKLTDTNLTELKNAGLDAGILSGLRAKISGQAVRRKAFDEMLDRIGNKNLMPNERKLILKYANLSLLRLERFIRTRHLRQGEREAGQDPECEGAGQEVVEEGIDREGSDRAQASDRDPSLKSGSRALRATLMKLAAVNAMRRP